MGPRSGLDDVEKRKILPLLGLELGPLGQLAHSQSLTIPNTLFQLLTYTSYC
jgi:hypothetical protein